MNKIAEAFKNKKAFISFLVAGDPTLDQTAAYIVAMAEAGSDLIEIGIPFSDPTAEGPVIQSANERALQNGATVNKIFDMVAAVREKTSVPLVFLTYLNPVFVYGYERFFAKCKAVGIDGIIIPDLPFEEQLEVLHIARNEDVDVITLIAPTSDDRIKALSQRAGGFIYLVSSLGVTGVRGEITTDIQAMVSQIKKETETPVAVGFGISTPRQAEEITHYADGVIVGSAIVKIIEQYGADAQVQLTAYVKEMKTAIAQR